MNRYFSVQAMVLACAILCAPVPILAQTVTLGGSLNVASAEDFATRAFQDPWDMNDRTDFGWFLHGADAPSPGLNNITFSNGIFSATTATSASLFLLETGNPFAARLGKTGYNHPIDAGTYRMLAIRMNMSASPSAQLVWERDNLWDGTTTISNTFPLTAGWRTYLIDLPTVGISSGSIAWGGLIRSLRFLPSNFSDVNMEIDWIRLVNINPSLCRQVTWSVAGAVNVYLDTDGATNGNETLLASNVTNGTGTSSLGCSASGSGYTFHAGALAPGSYQVLVRPSSGGSFTRSTSAYIVNAAPTVYVTAPSEEGSSDDFATTQLGNPWDMDAVTDVDATFNVTGAQITTVQAETPAGTQLPNTRVYLGTSTVPPSGQVGDPRLAMLWDGGSNANIRIDPNRYRILTVEFGLPNRARSINTGSVARIVWRVAGSSESVSDDIVFNSRTGANVLDKFSVDMADRSVLSIEQGSTIGWVPGNSSTPGINRFRFDVHEFSSAVPFHVRRVKLASMESAVGNYTISWNVSKGGTVTLYRDTDRDPSSGLTQIGSTAASAGDGSFVWAVNAPAGAHYIYVEINDGSGNSNAAYSRWPVLTTGGPPPPSPPPNIRILQ